MLNATHELVRISAFRGKDKDGVPDVSGEPSFWDEDGTYFAMFIIAPSGTTKQMCIVYVCATHAPIVCLIHFHTLLLGKQNATWPRLDDLRGRALPSNPKPCFNLLWSSPPLPLELIVSPLTIILISYNKICSKLAACTNTQCGRIMYTEVKIKDEVNCHSTGKIES